MLILNFDLGAHARGIFVEVFNFVLFFLHRAGQILHLFVHLASLSSLLLHFALELVD